MPQLHDLDVEWVSLVDRAAVRDPQQKQEPMRFLLWKRDHEGERMTAEEMRAELEKAQADLRKAEEERDAATAKAQKVETEKADLARQLDEAKAEPARKTEGEQIDKSELPEAVRKALEKAEKAAEADRERAEKAERAANDAAEIAKSERDARLTREFVAKAEGYRALAINADEFGPVLKAAAEKLTKDEFEAIEEALNAADGALQETDLFKEQGRSREGEQGDAYTEIVAKAEEIRKADTALTREQAIAKAMEQNPDLQARYAAEQR